MPKRKGRVGGFASVPVDSIVCRNIHFVYFLVGKKVFRARIGLRGKGRKFNLCSVWRDSVVEVKQFFNHGDLGSEKIGLVLKGFGVEVIKTN